MFDLPVFPALNEPSEPFSTVQERQSDASGYPGWQGTLFFQSPLMPLSPWSSREVNCAYYYFLKSGSTHLEYMLMENHKKAIQTHSPRDPYGQL